MKKTLISLSLVLLATSSAIAQEDETPSRKTRTRSPIAPTGLIVAVSPLHVTEESIGLGLSLEVFTSKSGIVSISLPFSMALSPNDGNRYYAYDDVNYGGYSTFEQYEKRRGMVYFYPGIKIYPTGANKRTSYAVGMNLVAGVGSSQQYTRNYKLLNTNNQYNSYYGERELVSENIANLSRFKIGAMVTNSLNIRPSNHFYIGVEFGLGYTYVNRLASQNVGREALVQLGVKFGLAN